MQNLVAQDTCPGHVCYTGSALAQGLPVKHTVPWGQGRWGFGSWQHVSKPRKGGVWVGVGPHRGHATCFGNMMAI